MIVNGRHIRPVWFAVGLVLFLGLQLFRLAVLVGILAVLAFAVKTVLL